MNRIIPLFSSDKIVQKHETKYEDPLYEYIYFFALNERLIKF